MLISLHLVESTYKNGLSRYQYLDNFVYGTEPEELIAGGCRDSCRATLDAIPAGCGVRPHGKTVTAIRLKARLVIPEIGILGIKNAFGRPARVVNPPLAQGLPDGLPPAGKTADDIFLENQKRPQNQHDKRDVFDEGLGFCCASA